MARSVGVQRLFDGLRWGTAIACGWECGTIITHSHLTLSQLTRRYPVIGFVIVAGLIAHLLWPVENPPAEKREEMGEWQQAG